MNWIAKQISVTATDRLNEYANNPRVHSDHQVAVLAEAIGQFGFTNPILARRDGTVIAGHGRLMAAKRLGLAEVPVIYVDHLSERQQQALLIADNKIQQLGAWDFDKLSDELAALADTEFDLSLTGFNEQELDALLKGDEDLLPDSPVETIAPPVHTVEVAGHTRTVREGLTGDDEVPEQIQIPVTQPGDVWQLGPHRVMCGDSTDRRAVEILMDGKTATLLHADPPYGMGKASEGVANDNLYREKLDEFQMAWWNAFRPSLINNASAYIWGNAEELWRLWFIGGLNDSEYLELRNEIVWDKKNIAGMASPDLTSYPTATERCLFLQIGDQYLRSANINSDAFPENWEPIRSYMQSQADAAGMGPKELKNLCGVGMYSHWFTKSQFTLIPERHYLALAAEYPGCFTRPWSELKSEWNLVRSAPLREVNGERREQRSYFNNAHDIMRDVWEFPRMLGEERFGHATPKPVEMIERAIKSSSRQGEVVVEPFGGTGPTLIACEKQGRVGHVMELVPTWVDVIVKRWQAFTGEPAILAGSNLTFDEVAAQRNG